MLLLAAPGLGSVSGVVHLAVRRPYIIVVAVVVLATVAFTHSATYSIPALSPPPVPTAPVVQHTRRRPVALRAPVGWHALGHRQNPAAKQLLTVKQRPGGLAVIPVGDLQP
jgi:hypothetical protein